MDHAAGATVAGLWKTYHTTPVLKGIDLSFGAGEVHALLGPNGAGKSTLLGCLSGAVQPDEGVITVDGTAHAGFTPASAFAAGIAIIYQHLQLFPDLTVAENVFLGQELTRRGQVWNAEQERQTRQLVHDLGLDVDVTLPVARLSVGEQQIVAIARALRHQPSTLILDEPTAALSDAEVEILLDLVRRLAKDKGIAVIYVTHLLREVLVVADRVSVIRDGSVLWTKDIAELDLDALVGAIAPTPVARTDGTRADTGPVLLELDGVDVHCGEIVGVFGLLGSGRTSLLEGIAGVRSPRSGPARLAGAPLPTGNPRRVLGRGVALVPSDRQEQALFGDLPAIENVLMPNYPRVSRWWRKIAREREVFSGVAGHVGLEPANPRMSAADFSGGNAQKLAVGRWITGLDATKVLLLDEPTQGVDVGARQDIYTLLRGYVSGAERAIVFASSDAEEVVTLADRVVVLVDGSPVAVVAPDVGESALIALAHGATPSQMTMGEQMMVATDVSTAVRPEQAERGRKLAGPVIQLFLPVAVLLLMVYFAVQSPVFLSYDNLMAIATQNAPTFIVSAALGAMMIAGYVDLSVGSMLAVAAVAAGIGWTTWGTAAGLGLGLLVGLVTGVVNGVLIAYLNWSPIVVGLGLLAFGRGLALFLAPDSLFGFPEAISEMGSGTWLGVSYLVWIAAVVCVSLVVVMGRLPLGRHITAVGVNKRAAFLAGVNVRPIVFGLYVTVGLAVAVAGILFAARLDSAPAGTLGVGFEITVLTAVLLGGIPFDGGRGSLWRVLVGVWLMGVLQNGITLMNIGPEVASMLTGGVLVLAAGLEAARRYVRN